MPFLGLGETLFIIINTIIQFLGFLNQIFRLYSQVLQIYSYTSGFHMTQLMLKLGYHRQNLYSVFIFNSFFLYCNNINFADVNVYNFYYY